VKIDPATLSVDAASFWETASIVPRPIAWTSTLNDDGSANLAPFSFFTGASADPPMCIICVSHHKHSGEPDRRKDRVGEAQLAGPSPSRGARDPLRVPRKKDTWVNIERTGEYVIHVVNDALAEKMNATARVFPYGVDEMAEVGLTKVAAERVAPPRVAEAPVAMECRLERIVEIGRAGTAVIIGEILLWHVQDELVVNGRLDMGRLDAVGRMAGSTYTRTRDRFDMVRPK
jgi:flavin reductase (DIM6/NTAB) family NADH-FMN oxidoreductase RutF